MATRRSRWQRVRMASAGWLFAWALRALGATWRVRATGCDTIAEGGLGATWHCNLLLGTVFFRDRGIAMCVSRSRDGDLIAAILRHIGYADPPRGSSSRGGSTVLRQLVRTLQNGVAVGLLTDGPRGPARRSRIGVVGLARLTGVPITPFVLSARPRLRLRSWDRTLLPMPFARVICHFGDPIAVPRDADPEREERLCRELDRELGRLTDAAEASLGLRGPAGLALDTW
jgi:lysophospholipid acyltransferase (LPLAT)-like uncharacterized protein